MMPTRISHLQVEHPTLGIFVDFNSVSPAEAVYYICCLEYTNYILMARADFAGRNLSSCFYISFNHLSSALYQFTKFLSTPNFVKYNPFGYALRGTKLTWKWVLVTVCSANLKWVSRGRSFSSRYNRAIRPTVRISQIFDSTSVHVFFTPLKITACKSNLLIMIMTKDTWLAYKGEKSQ